jgi:hypothetical protein
MNADEFVQLISQLSKDEKAFTLGKVDPYYSSGRPRILFDGETQVSAKGYPYLSSYSPVANHRVLLANIGGSHVVIGRIL